MKTIVSYLNDLKDKTGSDYKIAKLMKTGQSTISNIRSRNQCGDETAIKIADLLEIDRNEVLIAAAIARSEGEVKKAWMNISKNAGIAANVAFATTLTLIALSSFYNPMYILCKIVYRIINGIVLALVSVLTTWSRNNGSTPKNQFLPHTKQTNTQQGESRRIVGRRRERNRTAGQGRRTGDYGTLYVAMG